MYTILVLIKPKQQLIRNPKRCFRSSKSFKQKKIHQKCVPHQEFFKSNKVFSNVSNCETVENNLKSTIKENIYGKTDDTVDNTSKTKIRKNDLNIQMLSENLYSQIFGNNTPNKPDPDLIKKAQNGLKKHGLWKENISLLNDVSIKLPPLKGKNIEEHFWNIGSEQSKPYENLLSSFIKKGIPKPPEKWVCIKGWTKYEEGKPPEPVLFPEETALVFDVEVCVKVGEAPTLATAVSEKAWYGWISSDVAEGMNPIPINHYTTDMLIPLEGKTMPKEEPRVVIGHNVSYDRARIKEQYYIKHSALRFMDTMSLHICIGGLTKTQKSILKEKKEDYIGNWKDFCLSSLKEIYFLYCDKELNKDIRNIFLKGILTDVRNDLQSLMSYCANDVVATYEVLQVMFPIFLERFPHPVTLAGMLEMGSGFLPVNYSWKKFLGDAEQTYDDLRNEINFMLSRKSDSACKLFYDDKYKEDLWMWNEDWSTQEIKLTKKKVKLQQPEPVQTSLKRTDEEDEEEIKLSEKFKYLFDLGQILPVKKPFLPGYPLWYRKLCEKTNTENWSPHAKVSTSMEITPKILKLSWENFPLYHTSEFGWGILVADIFTQKVNTEMPFQSLKKLTLKNCNINPSELENKFKISKMREKKINKTFYYKGNGIWCNHMVNECCFFYKLPHKDGNMKNVGNPLSNSYTETFSSNVLKGSDYVAEKVLDLKKKLTYWGNNRERILKQMVVWLNKRELSTPNGTDEEIPVGVIIPQVVICGTLTRRAMEATWLTASKTTENRIGSELRSMIQAPPGYHIVGADVDSQELWISSLIGDSYFAKTHGSTPLGWMTLSGTKSNETDMHSVTAKAAGISRDHAKVINYARIYGAGVKFAQKLLQRFNPSMGYKEAYEKASKMYELTKGKKLFKLKESVIEEYRHTFGLEPKIYDINSAVKLARYWDKDLGAIFEKSYWIDGTESAMFNELERMANLSNPVTPFLQCRLSRALEPKFKNNDAFLTTRMNWVVQSGAVDFLHLMLVCMKWLTKGTIRYCFSFHDEIRYLVPSEIKYNAALAIHITNLLVRSFCSSRLGIYDLPQSVAFFSSVEVDKTLRKESNDDCITPSNPHGMKKGYGVDPGESLNIYETLKKAESLSVFTSGKNSEMSEATKRKHVRREVLYNCLDPPEKHQQIVRVLGSRGNNLHEVETSESSSFLVSMPNKFRKNVWIKKGDFILVEPIEEGDKVKAEMVKVLTSEYIKFLKKEKLWPSGFERDEEKHINESSDAFINRNHRNRLKECISGSDSE